MEFQISFKGDSIEDKKEIKTVIFANELLWMIEEVKQRVRARRKHGEGLTEKEEEFLEDIMCLIDVEWLD